jgi:predicted nucleic-acid-binding Zn-ribbon protein
VEIVEPTYPPYSGEEPTCPKCFSVSAYTTYMPYGRCSHAGRDSLVIGLMPNERLHRSCSNCGYAWDEAVQS